MSPLAQRIQEIIDAGHPQIALAKAAKVTKATVNQWLNGGIQSIKLEYAQGIQILTGYSAEWLVTGKGEKKSIWNSQKNNVVGVGDDDDNPNISRIRRVKLRLSAGIAGFVVDVEQGDASPIFFRNNWLAGRGFNPDKLIAIQVKGASMEPGLYEGDTVVINTADTTPKDGEVFAINYEGEAVIKRMMRDGGTWWLCSDNSNQRRFQRKECKGDMCLVIGRVIHKQSERI